MKGKGFSFHLQTLNKKSLHRSEQYQAWVQATLKGLGLDTEKSGGAKISFR